MRSFRHSLLAVLAVAMIVFLAVALLPMVSQASVYSYSLSDHPDGNANPPPYGLRIDDLFKGTNIAFGGTTTFSFDNPNSLVWAQIDDVANTMRIFGTARGGKDNGSNYDTEVQVWIDFTYSALDLTGFAPSSPNLIVPPGTGSGTVTVTQEISNATGLLGNVYEFESKANNSGNQFNFLNTTHRDFNGINGWGWVTVTGAKNADGDDIPFFTSGTHDWLFTAEVIPEPGTMAVWSGLIAVVGLRRRQGRQG